MPGYCLLMNWTDQGIRGVRDGGKRIDAGRELARNLGIEFLDLSLCMGPYDIMVRLDAPDDATMARFALALGSRGNVRTTTVRIFPEEEYRGMLGNLPS
jgi:uncharacterized protein with GYD domain